MKTLKKIMSFAIVICFLFNTASPAFAVSDLDMLRSMIKQIERVDIMDDEAVLAIGNDIERANEIYNTLSLADKASMPSAESSMLEAYIERMAEILSMGRLRSPSPRATTAQWSPVYTGNTYTKDNVSYYEWDNFSYGMCETGSANYVPFEGKVYNRTYSASDTCKVLKCVDSTHSSIHNSSFFYNLGVRNSKWDNHAPFKFITGTYGSGYNAFSMLLSMDSYIITTGYFKYGTNTLNIYNDGTIGNLSNKPAYKTVNTATGDGNWQTTSHILGNLNTFINNGGSIILEIDIPQYNTIRPLGIKSKIIITKDEKYFDSIPPTQPTITAKPVARFYVEPIDNYNNTKNAVEFLGYSTHEEIEQEKIERAKRKVLSANTFEHDVLYKLIKNISRNDINDDAVVLSIGNEIERAFEIYSSLSASEQELFPAEEKEILLRYVNRMSEILSMNKLRSPSARITTPYATGNTLIFENTLFWEYSGFNCGTGSFNGKYYIRGKNTNHCTNKLCDDTTHKMDSKYLASYGLNYNSNSQIDGQVFMGESGWGGLVITRAYFDEYNLNLALDPYNIKFYKGKTNFHLNGSYPTVASSWGSAQYNIDFSSDIKVALIKHGSMIINVVLMTKDMNKLVSSGVITSLINPTFGRVLVASGMEAFDTSPPTVPTISLTEKLKQVLSATLDWFSGDVEITIGGSTDTGGSGLKGYEYQIDGGAWQTYTSPFTVSVSSTVNARASDNANNRSTNATKQIKIDKTAPTAPVITKSPTREFANSDVVVTISHGTDSQSGIAKTEYQIDSGVWQEYTIPITISFTSTIKARTIDNVNNISPEASEAIKIDRDVPTDPVITKSPNGEFANADVTITIDGSTDSGGSELKGYEYQIDGGAWQPYTVPFVITSTATVNARASDNALNISTISAEEVKIDRTAPTTPSIVKSPIREFANDDVTVVVISGTDDYSGVNRTEYKIDSGTWITYTAPLIVSSTSTIKARTIDNAKNISIEVSEEIKIDRVAPSAPVIIKSPADEFASGDVTITINGSTDIGGSGIKDYEYQLDGGTWQAYTVPLTITSTSSINARVIDNALNYSSLSTEEVKIDRTPPTFYYRLTPDNWTNGDVTISVNIGDADSGIKSIAMTSPSAISVDIGTAFINTTTASFTVDKNAIYSFIATNHAGISVEFDTTVDKIEDLPPTPPKVDESGEGTPPTDPTVPDHIEKDWGNAPIELPLVSDAPSGIKKFQYIIENSTPTPIKRTRSALLRQSWIDYDGTVFKVVAEGEYTLKVRSISNAGNISDVSTYLIRNDYTAPTATHEFKDNKAVITADDTLSGIGKITCSHGEILSNIIECEIQAGSSHDYKIYDTAGNILGYSVKTVTPHPSSGGNGDNYEYPPIVPKDEPKKEMPIKLAPSKPTITGNEKPNSANESGGEIITSTNDEKNAQIKPPIANEVTPDATGDNNTVKRAGGISWCIWIFIILILIALVVLIREIFYNKEGEDENNVW